MYATYTYDAWGNVLSATGSLASINPLRYRGYYYDTETGWYYLQSRYYDPAVKRFINADDFTSTGQGFLGCNMFAYCNNNPIGADDSDGHARRRTESSRKTARRRSVAKTNSRSSRSRNNKRLIRDVTDEVNAALKKARTVARIQTVISCFDTISRASQYLSFYVQEKKNGIWDIKEKTSWEITIGTEFPGDEPVLYENRITNAHELGNYCYGYLGRENGFSLDILLTGSYYAAGFPNKDTEPEEWHEEVINDWPIIEMGFKHKWS